MKAIQLLKDFQGNRSQLARDVGVTPQTLNNWIPRGNIPSKYLTKLAKALSKALGRNVKIEELL